MFPLNVIAALTGKVTLTDASSSGTGSNAAGLVEGRIHIRASSIVEIDTTQGGLTQIFPATDWLIPRLGMALYEVRCTVLSGTLDGFGSAVNTWLSMASDYNWGASTAAVNTLVESEVLVEMRIGTSVLDSATYNLSATKGTP